jgi:hypothetical protein
MNVYRAEVFRYGKSFYGRMIMILVIPFAILVAAFLHYVSAGVSSDFLAAAGFSEQTIKGQMDGIAYIASAFSASELLVLLMMFPVILHISEDYEQNTIRCELQRSKSRAACYIARVLAAVTYAWGILLEYILISGIAAALFFRNVPEASEASRIGKTMLAIVLQFIMIGACAMFAFMLVSLIRHSVLSMTAAVLLVLLFTPGVRVLVDLFNLPAWFDNIWIVQLLGMTSDLTFNGTDAVAAIIISLLYAVISTGLGIHFFKAQKI